MFKKNYYLLKNTLAQVLSDICGFESCVSNVGHWQSILGAVQQRAYKPW